MMDLSEFGSAFDGAADALLVLDPQRDAIVDANPVALSLLGYARDALLAQSASALHPGQVPASSCSPRPATPSPAGGPTL